MNEITQIHLGRTAFTIAVDAQKLLHDYLASVKKHMGGNEDAANEVELRMAELLIERGITNDKVVLASDIEYLKSQLGEPGDFDDHEGEAKEAKNASEDTGPRRLFRDTEHGMVAGVAAGLANYFQIDAVIVRILFVVATLAGGWGIPIYLLLWFLVPEAKTGSDRLQMRGLAVNVDNLKEAVAQADVPGATRRASQAIGVFLRGVGKVVLAVVGLAVATGGLLLLFAAVATGFYLARRSPSSFGGLFPVGGNEVLLAVAIVVSAGLIALLLMLTGAAMVNRRWQLSNWVAAALSGLLLFSLAGGTALAVDAVPEIRSRYIAAHHITARALPPFTQVAVVGPDTEITYSQSDTYAVELHYLGNPNLKPIKTQVKDGILTINTQSFAAGRDCSGVCGWFNTYDLKVVVRAPQLPKDIRRDGGTIMLVMPGKPFRIVD